MHKNLKPVLSLLSMLVISASAQSTPIPNTDDPVTFVGPTAALSVANLISDNLAFALLGEAGVKNFRIGGTLGFRQSDFQRFKVTAEWLTQDITYAFFSGNDNKWVNQAAFGAAYQYDLPYQFSPQFEISGFYSHAPSTHLNTVTGTYVNRAGNLTSYTDVRRIAGSNAYGFMPSLSLALWQGGRVTAGLNYDDVHYDKLSLPNENAVGFGGTAGLSQIITNGIELGLEAEIRQPFYNYSASLSWENYQYFNNWSFSLFGNYTDGLNTLPNTYNVGIGAAYNFDKPNLKTAPASMKDKDGFLLPQIPNGLLGWTSKPAVYMPQVLAIADSLVTIAPTCTSAVTYVGPANIDNLFLSSNSFTVDYAPYFSGTAPITFSQVTTVDTGTGSPSDCSINATTGVLSCNNIGTGFYRVTVTATNACGSASKSASYAD